MDLEGEIDPIRLSWTNETTYEDQHSKKFSIQIKGDTDEKFKLRNVRTISNLTLPVQTVNLQKLKKSWTHLQSVPVAVTSSCQPKILIGQDNIHLTVARQVIEGPVNSPVATKTKLG